MTRFQQEIKGIYGAFFLEGAIREANEAKKEFDENAYVEDGVVRWLSNDRIPHDDMLEKMEYMGCKFDRAKCNELRQKEDEIEIKKYLEKNFGESEENYEEMKNVFGIGATVVDLLTGRKITL